MANLICDLHFWSLKEDLSVRDTDFACFKYFDKTQQKTALEKPYAQDKLSFANGRGQTCFIDSKRPNRLRSNFRELEEVLEEQTVVFAKWRSSTLYQMMFSNGVIANIFLNTMADVEKVTFDKFLVGRLLDHISQVHFSSRMMIVTYLVSKVTIVTFAKPLHFLTRDIDTQQDKMKPFENLAQFEPKVQVLDILGPAGRRLYRNVVVSEDSNLVLFWWSTNGQEVFPWAPHLKDEDRANIMIFSFNGSDLKRIGFTRTNTDPIAIRFVIESGKVGIHYLGQDVTRRGEVHVESVNFVVADGDRKLRRKSSKKLIDNSEIVSSIFVSEHLVILGGADGTLLLMDIVQHKLECQTKCAFVPTFLKLHPDQGLFIVANERGLIQCFDVALSPIRLHFAIDDVITGNILDMSAYFSTAVTLADLTWCSRKKDLGSKPCPMEAMALNYLLLRFQGGPLVLVRISGGCLSSPSPGSLGPLQISADYLAHDQYQQALLLLNQLDWKLNGQTLMISITNVFHKIIRRPIAFTPDKESLLEMCLGLFHAPTKPIPDDTVDEYSEQMHDLSRKFFHELLRHHRFTKAFRLAVDLNDYDLFMDIHHAANRLRRKRQNDTDTTPDDVEDAEIDGLADLAQAALIKNLISKLHVSSTPARLTDPNDQINFDPDVSSEPVLVDPPAFSPSHHELGIPIVPSTSTFGLRHSTPTFHLTSFNTRNFQLTSAPQSFSPVRTAPLKLDPHSMFGSGVIQGLDQDEDTRANFLSEIGLKTDNEMESFVSQESSLASMQPELSATFLKTTAAKRIPTNAFQKKAEPNLASSSTFGLENTTGSAPTDIQTPAPISLPKSIEEESNTEDIQVIHFGLV